VSKPETARQAEIVAALERCGLLVLRLQCGLARGWKGGRMTLCPPGTPDLLVVGCCFLETKTDDGKLNENQVKMHRTIRAQGWEVHTVRTPHEALRAVGLMERAHA
jgi:hypothetical protein